MPFLTTAIRGTATTCLTAVGIATFAPSVAAQNVPSPYQFVERSQDLGPFVAWLSTSRGSADLGPKSGPVYGLQYAIRINDPMQFSALGGFMRAERDVIDPGAEGGPAVIDTEDFTLVTLAGRLQLNLTGARTWNNLMPYILAGLGLAFDATGQQTCTLQNLSPECRLDPDERFGFNTSVMGQAGVGTAWLPSERFGLRFTIHDNIWRIESPPGWRDPQLELPEVPPETEWLNNIQFTASLSYWF